MRQNVVLIDFENVQPLSFAALAQDHFRVLVFVGANQAKVPFDIAASLQQLGSRAEYIKITGNGSNALDFHIAYYIGKIASTDPSAYFHVVSKDSGFDPLIAHLKHSKILANRVKDVADIPMIKLAATKTPEERVGVVLERWRQSRVARPRTLKTLNNAVASYFHKQLSDEEVSAVVDGLIRAGAVAVAGTNVTYAAGCAA